MSELKLKIFCVCDFRIKTFYEWFILTSFHFLLKIVVKSELQQIILNSNIKQSYHENKCLKLHVQYLIFTLFIIKWIGKLFKMQGGQI